MEINIKVREELFEVIDGFTDEQINHVLEEGKWTIAQVLEHLYLTEKLVVRSFTEAIPVTEEDPVKLKKVHLTQDRSQKVNAPKFLVPSNEYQTIEQLKEKLKKSRESLEKFMGDISEHDLNGKYLPHPFFDKLTLKQWVEFLGYHEKRHIGQIEELKKALTK
ncbi:DinB family protein [Ureibacillus sp. MALMAid1270]|uniref:DinB family protein n=1 Tax=Ureibacillus sp. MALMAid1270 TaxID=3411629 RepID=UPI003BA5842D